MSFDSAEKLGAFYSQTYVKASDIESKETTRHKAADLAFKNSIIALLEKYGGLSACNIAWALRGERLMCVGEMETFLQRAPGMSELEFKAEEGKYFLKKSPAAPTTPL